MVTSLRRHLLGSTKDGSYSPLYCGHSRLGDLVLGALNPIPAPFLVVRRTILKRIPRTALILGEEGGACYDLQSNLQRLVSRSLRFASRIVLFSLLHACFCSWCFCPHDTHLVSVLMSAYTWTLLNHGALCLLTRSSKMMNIYSSYAYILKLPYYIW